ncbi:MAG: hypothetical protein JSW64_00900 [Candidatus Zixiibacteriota bacterium]|nr:MAG: hypothetical protein JSW64_00900 [candidate division Zixibacteria bacterium]
MKDRLFLLLALTLLWGGCFKDPISTRDTQDPYGSSGTWETPQSPEVAVNNLLFAYNEMIISNYQLCFSDSFIYSSPEDSIDAVNDGRGDLFANWNRSVEISVTNNIFSTYSNDDSSNLILALGVSNEYSDQIEDSTAILHRDYDLVVITSNEDTALYSGRAVFHLSEEQLNWWTIYLWEDVPVDVGDDWGDFKALFR